MLGFQLYSRWRRMALRMKVSKILIGAGLILAAFAVEVIIWIAWVSFQQPALPSDPVMRRYEEVRRELVSAVQREGAREAIERFKTLLDDPDVSRLCHGLAHEIGRAAYERYGFEESFVYEDDVCGSGYTHGIVETHFETVEDPLAALPDFCAPTSGKCFHGLGHGLMYAWNNDLPRSIDACGTLAERFQKIQCAEGVFMENFGLDERSHPSEYLRRDDAFFPCRSQEEPYRGVCAFYAPRYYLRQQPGAYAEAMRWCAGVGEGPRDGCAKGVGSVAMKENIGDPALVESICDGAAADQERYCIEGMVSYYIVHYASAAKGRELCGMLSEEHRASCEKIATESERFYGE